MERPRTELSRSRQEVQEVGPGDFAGGSAERRLARGAEDLHVCPSCSSELVHPTDWVPASARRWTVQLRCPDCEWTGGGTYAQAVVDRFDEVLDDGTESVLNDLQRLSRANMEQDTESFISALWAERILPEDF
jgi:predicted RNA-binding Zn-ribbon protein involved in translation (DUF1610 family)